MYFGGTRHVIEPLYVTELDGLCREAATGIGMMGVAGIGRLFGDALHQRLYNGWAGPGRVHVPSPQHSRDAGTRRRTHALGNTTGNINGSQRPS